MSMRLLTKKFCSYTIAKCEKQFKKEFMDFIDVGNLSIEKMLILIQMGNNMCSEEEAGEKLDNYLSDENNGLVDAYLQLLDEVDRDVHILKGTGISIESLKEELYKKVENKASENTAEVNNVLDFDDYTTKIEDNSVAETVLKPTETPKVDVNGFVSLDEY